MKIQNDNFSLEISDDILKKLISQHSDPYDAQKQIFGFIQSVRFYSSDDGQLFDFIWDDKEKISDQQSKANEDVIAPEGYFYVVKFKESDFLSAIDYDEVNNVQSIQTSNIEDAWYSSSLSQAIELVSEYYQVKAWTFKYLFISITQRAVEAYNSKLAPRIILVPESDLLPQSE